MPTRSDRRPPKRPRARRSLALRLWLGLPLQFWHRVVLVLAAPVVAFLVLLNGTVAWIGDTLIFPLSPFYVDEKLGALWAYSKHRPICMIVGHDHVDDIVRRAAAKHHIDRYLLAALVHVESRSKPHRISPVGAMGAAQLMPGTALMLRVDDPFDPEQGIDGGARYLKEQLTRFGSARLAVAAYNAGPGSIRNGQVPRNGETEYYVENVMDRWAQTRPREAPAKRR